MTIDLLEPAVLLEEMAGLAVFPPREGTKQGHSTFGETSDSGCVVFQARQRLTHPWRRILDGTHLNHTLVKDGWCYRKYAPLDTKLEMLEAVAKAARRGLWADPKPVPPWEGRKIKKLSVNP